MYRKGLSFPHVVGQICFLKNDKSAKMQGNFSPLMQIFFEGKVNGYFDFENDCSIGYIFLMFLFQRCVANFITFMYPRVLPIIVTNVSHTITILVEDEQH